MKRKNTWRIVLAACLAAASPLAAGYAQVAARAFAADSPGGFSFVAHEAGSTSDSPPVAAGSTLALAGSSFSTAEAYVNGLTGVVRAKIFALVGADRWVPGRNAGGRTEMSLTGDITLSGPAVPGLATFTALLEGAYALNGFPTFDDRIDIRSRFSVGSSGEMRGDLLETCCGAGTFIFPFTWTQTVHSGDTIRFALNLDAQVSSVAGSSEVDALNTFKITGIDLPPGYTFAPGANGFLSEFNAPVPEPSTGALLAAGLACLLWTARKRGGQKA